jgi:hypothetical protein
MLFQPRYDDRPDWPGRLRGQPAQGSFVRHLAARMLFVLLLAMAATASGLLLYDRWQPPEERIAAVGADSTGQSQGAPTSRTELPPPPSLPDSSKPAPPKQQTPAISKVPAAPEKKTPLPEPPPESVAKSEEPKTAPEEPKTAPMERKPAPEEPKTAPPQPAVDPAKREAFRRAVSMARQAIGKRDFAGAKRHLKTAEANLQNPADEAELGRLELLLGNLEEFWKGMRKIVAGLVPAQEIMLGETPIIVVQVDAKQLTVRSEGRNLTYRIDNLPRPIIEALAQSGFVKHPSTYVLLGTYMAMDPNGDRKRAQQLWEQAARQGEDVRDLMAEIKDEKAAGSRQ